jgi:hypothetical protein
MSHVWIYDRNNSTKYRTAAARARSSRRRTPARYLVMFYDRRRPPAIEIRRHQDRGHNTARPVASATCRDRRCRLR